VPGYIVDNLRSIYLAQGELFASQLNTADQDRAPKIVPWADGDAEAVFQRFADEVEDQEGLEGDIRARSVETAVRLATIRALGRDGPGRGCER
jgi:hypothetical protein